MNRRAFIAIVIFFALPVLPIRAQSPPPDNAEQKSYLYEWTDDKGVVHITDTPGVIPEQYRAKARKVESQKGEEGGSGQQLQKGAEPSFNSETVHDEQGKAEWQQRIKSWRDRLANAEAHYRELDQERTELLGVRGSAALAPLENRQRAEQIVGEMKDVQSQIDEARRMLEEVIPEEARKAGVPPGWLRE